MPSNTKGEKLTPEPTNVSGAHVESMFPVYDTFHEDAIGPSRLG
jgi:hypothetical protein